MLATCDFNQAGRQMDKLPSINNAELKGRSGDRNEHVDSSTTQEQVGLAQNVSATESTPVTPKTLPALLSIEVTDENGSNTLIVSMKPNTPMESTG
jgi:hypothetical protein